uniref:Secreted protein n=1 Tax=Angiostrongylus cantonensis TaxID=6313 RepID=A0A0K0DET7_ANGCA
MVLRSASARLILGLQGTTTAKPAKSLAQYTAHWALSSMTSDGATTGQRRPNLGFHRTLMETDKRAHLRQAMEAASCRASITP